MKFQYLISQSKANLQLNPPKSFGVFSLHIFRFGAKWMFNKLHEDKLDNHVQFNSTINYFAYGIVKYGISFILFLLSAIIFIKVNLFFLPISILLFYLSEIHFLFLFPLLIDNIENPILTSIKQTYKIGVLTTLLNVIPIGLFMLFGLLNYKDPFRNWYIGCLSIVIWYKDEIRNRV
jgi:hypothetical protein